eukprot:3941944-Rhodomonas_salina.1
MPKRKGRESCRKNDSTRPLIPHATFLSEEWHGMKSGMAQVNRSCQTPSEAGEQRVDSEPCRVRDQTQ